MWAVYTFIGYLTLAPRPAGAGYLQTYYQVRN